MTKLAAKGMLYGDILIAYWLNDFLMQNDE